MTAPEEKPTIVERMRQAANGGVTIANHLRPDNSDKLGLASIASTVNALAAELQGIAEEMRRRAMQRTCGKDGCLEHGRIPIQYEEAYEWASRIAPARASRRKGGRGEATDPVAREG